MSQEIRVQLCTKQYFGIFSELRRILVTSLVISLVTSFRALNVGTVRCRYLFLIGVENVLYSSYILDFSSFFSAEHEIVSSWVNIKFHGRVSISKNFRTRSTAAPPRPGKDPGGCNLESFTSRTRAWSNAVTQAILIVDIKRADTHKEGYYCAVLYIEDVMQRYKNDLFQAECQ